MTRRVLCVIGVAVVTLAAIEGAVRVVAPRIPAPSDWHYIGVQELVESMDVIRDASATSDLVLAGTSLAQRLRAPILEVELESVSAARNLSLFNAHTSVQRRWLLEEVIPRLQPDRVVWGLASLDFNGGRPQKEIEVYESSRAGKVGISGAIDRFLAEHSMMVRYRQEVRGPLFFTHIFDERLAEPAPSSVPIDAVLERSDIWEREQTDEDFAALRGRELFDFHIGEREAADFVITVNEMLNQGIEVVLVLMPVSAEYIQANDEGLDDFSTWIAWMVATAGELGVPLFDYSSVIPADLFGDFIHLNIEGADLLSELLASDLRGLGW